MKHEKILKNKKFWILLAALFLCWKFFLPPSQSGNALQVLRSVKVQKGNLTIQVTSTGEVKPYNRVEVKPPIAGRVDTVMVQEGAMVKQGEVVAWMSSTERAALLDAAKSQGEEIFKRWQEIYKPAPLIAPLEAMVIVRSVEPGQTVTTADPVVVLADHLIVEALVDETDLGRIKLEQKAEIRLDAYPDMLIEGKVEHISYESTLMNNVNVYAVDIVPHEVPSNFRSGMTANVAFIVEEQHDVLLVPSEAVAEWPKNMKKPEGADFALYRKGLTGKLIPVAVRIGMSDGEMTEILQGVGEGSEIQVVRKKEKQASNSFLPGPRGGNQRKSQGK